MPIETIATEPPVFVRKKKGMKRFKGLITGKSRKEKRNARAEAKRVPGDASVTPYADIGDDTSTVYGAHMDSTVVTSVLPEPSLIADPVQVVLLVMDPATRRFELLQLEFDSTMAKVSDIYKQIPTAATEAVLQSALYKAIVTAKGEVWKSDDLLAHNVDGAAVVIAVREDDAETINKLVNMAVPILTNKKVRKMLISSGIKQEDLPLKPPSKTRSPRSPPTTESPGAKSEEEMKPRESLSSIDEIEPEKKKPVGIKNFSLGLLFGLFVHLFVKTHIHISAPFQPGSTLPLGKFKYSCGLLGPVKGILGPVCEPKTVIMGSDGVLTVLDGDQVVYTVTGSVCAKGAVDCIDGVIVEEDGTFKIGGKKVKAKGKPSINLTPWPFSGDVVYGSALKIKI